LLLRFGVSALVFVLGVAVAVVLAVIGVVLDLRLGLGLSLSLRLSQRSAEALQTCGTIGLRLLQFRDARFDLLGRLHERLSLCDLLFGQVVALGDDLAAIGERLIVQRAKVLNAQTVEAFRLLECHDFTPSVLAGCGQKSLVAGYALRNPRLRRSARGISTTR